MRKKEKIYIIPTEYGLMYGAGILVSLIGGAIYNNNLAFLLCFFLVALFLIGMVQTHNNLKNLEIEKFSVFLSPSDSVGHGVIWLKSSNSEGHIQIRVQCKDNDDQFNMTIDSIYRKSLHPHYFDFSTGGWGKKKIKKLRISTRYPFGFFYAWRVIPFPTEYFVFPKPSGSLVLQGGDPEGVHFGLTNQRNGDDFSEHKNYAYGDSYKHIDWKAFARGRPLLTKKFEEGQKQTLTIDYDLTKGNTEMRFRQLSQWVHDCSDENLSFSLKIMDQKIPTNFGEHHKLTCLKLIASHREV